MTRILRPAGSLSPPAEVLSGRPSEEAASGRSYRSPGGRGMALANDPATAPIETIETIEDDGSAYINRDMAPTPLSGRKWGARDIAALWISMSACIPTYML